MTLKEQCLRNEIEYLENCLSEMTPEERKAENFEHGMVGIIRQNKKELEKMERPENDYQSANENNPLPGTYPESVEQIPF